MAIELYAWDVLSNHLHILLGIRPDIAASWSDEEVIRRYLTLWPCKWRRRILGIPVNAPPTPEEIEAVLQTPGRVGLLRERMSSLSWFMAKLKEPIARRANREDDCTGHFWEGRFRSIAVLDEAAILAVSTYIDLNSIRAGVIDRLEDSRHGSIGYRAARAAGRRPRTNVALQGIPGFTNKQYLEHVDTWARTVAPGKHSTPRSLPPVLERLGISRRSFGTLLKRGWDRISGTAIGCADSIDLEAERRGGRWIQTPIRI